MKGMRYVIHDHCEVKEVIDSWLALIDVDACSIEYVCVYLSTFAC